MSIRNDQRKVFMKRYPDLVKYLVVNDLTNIPNPVVSVTARNKELYFSHLFPDCKTSQQALKECQNKKILDVGCGYNPLYDESLMSYVNKNKKMKSKMLGRDIIDMDMPNYQKSSILTMKESNVDTILINNFLYFWMNKPNDLMKAYKNMHKCLKKGGEIRVFPVYMENYYCDDENLKKYINENFFVRLLKPHYYDEDPFYQDKEVDEIYVLTGLGKKEAKINSMLNSHTLILKKV